MNKILATMALIASILTASALADETKKEPEDMLKFRNGDKLGGALLNLEPDAVFWSSPNAKRPIKFGMDSVMRLSLHNKGKATADLDHLARIHLTNGDRIPGEIVEMDIENLTLRTRYAGDLVIARRMIEGIQVSKGETLIYEGPNGFEEWVVVGEENVARRNGRQVPSGWQYSDGKLVSRGDGSITQDIKMPKQVEVEMEMSWNGYPNMWLSLFTDEKGDSVVKGAYTIALNYSSVNLSRGTRKEKKAEEKGDEPAKDARRQQLLNGFGNGFGFGHVEVHGGEMRPVGGPFQTQELRKKKKIKLNLFLDETNKEITLFLDDKQVKQWNDEDGFDGKHTGIALRSFRSSGIRLSKLAVSKWNGILPDAIEDEGEEANAEDEGEEIEEEEVPKDEIALANRDAVEGSLDRIEDGLIYFKTDYADLKIPVKRTTSINVVPEEFERARRRAGDVRGLFRNGGEITFEMLGAEQGKLIGKSENFGESRFDISAFKELVFHIYDEEIHGDVDAENEDAWFEGIDKGMFEGLMEKF